MKPISQVFSGVLGLVSVCGGVRAPSETGTLVGEICTPLMRREKKITVASVQCAMALKPDSSVPGLVSYAWAGFGDTFGPLVILSLYRKRMTRNGAMAGIIGGGITVLVWKQLEGGLFDLYEIVPGFLISTLLMELFSLLDKKPTHEVADLFDRVKGGGKYSMYIRGRSFAFLEGSCPTATFKNGRCPSRD